MFGQRSTSFSHERGDAFQIFYCVSFEGLLVVGIHAKVLPAVAVEVFRGTGLATRATATVVRTISIGVARTGALTFGRVISVTLSLFAGRRRRRGRGLRAANVPRAPATDVAFRTRVLGARPVAIRIGRARSVVVPGAIKRRRSRSRRRRRRRRRQCHSSPG